MVVSRYDFNLPLNTSRAEKFASFGEKIFNGERKYKLFH